MLNFLAYIFENCRPDCVGTLEIRKYQTWRNPSQMEPILATERVWLTRISTVSPAASIQPYRSYSPLSSHSKPPTVRREVLPIHKIFQHNCETSIPSCHFYSLIMTNILVSNHECWDLVGDKLCSQSSSNYFLTKKSPKVMFPSETRWYYRHFNALLTPLNLLKIPITLGNFWPHISRIHLMSHSIIHF